MKTLVKILPRFDYIAVFFLIILSSFIIFSYTAALSAQVELAWDPNTEQDLAGYKLYYGFESGNYIYSIDVGNQASYLISDLEPNRIHYFAATAYDTNGNESDFSEEITTLVSSGDMPPVANAGPDQTVDEGVTATLDGSNSTDPNNDILSHLWEQTNGPVVVLSSSDNGSVTFTAPDVGPDGVSLAFKLTTTDGTGLQSEDDCIINVTWVNLPPAAGADLDQTVGEGATVTLSGLDSSDPDDGIASYLWEQKEGTPVTISDPTNIQTSFVAPNASLEGVSLTFQLTVEDFGGLRSTDTCVVNVTWTNIPPTADAGPDQTVDEGVTATLDGSNSTDPNNDIIAHLWEQTNGPVVVLSSSDNGSVTFMAPDVSPDGTSLAFKLTTTDSTGLQSEDDCIINVTWVNLPPAADADLDQTVDQGATVILSGFDSSDPDDGIASYFWEQKGGTPVIISDPTDIRASFLAPDASSEDVSLTFQLTVEDFGGLRSTDTCVVNVPWTNIPPTADAGPDQTVDEGVTVTLDGSNSTDPNNDIIAHLWEQTNGPVVVLSSSEDGSITFTAPDVGPDGVSLTFKLTTTDSTGLQSEDDCIINVTWVNLPPAADADLDQTVDEGAPVILSGLDSSDPDDGIASYFWEQKGGTPVIISDPTDIRASFLAPDASSEDVSLTFQLTVEDFGGLRSTDTCVVNVSWMNTPPTADAGPDQTVGEGVTVTLDGSNSSDPDDGIASARWNQLSGIPVAFSDPTTLNPTFVFPDGVAEGEFLTFQLTVTDIGGLASQDTCIVVMAGNTVYEDAEDGNTQGWAIYFDNDTKAKIGNIFDNKLQSRAIKVKGSKTDSMFVLQNEDGTQWHNSKQLTIQWNMEYREDFIVYLDVETSAGHRYITYTPDDYDGLGTGEYVHYGLGSSAKDGQWRTFTRDLQADLEGAQSGVSIFEVNGFIIGGSGKVDDIQLLSR